MSCIRERRNRLVIDFCDYHDMRSWINPIKGTTKTEAERQLRGIEDIVKAERRFQNKLSK